MATSSNLVRVAYIPETVYGVTPATGNFDTLRFTSESLSGTPDTVESQQIRIDRMSSGQVVTGLSVEGGFDFELAKEAQLESILESVMYNTWQTQVLQTVTLNYDHTLKQITRTTGSFASPALVAGDFIKLAGFANPLNNVEVMVTQVVSTTVIAIAGPPTMVTQTGGTSYKRADKLSIGTTKKSFSVEKTFTDMTTKAIIYRGMIAGQMDLNVAYGELVTGSITLMGNDYATAASAGEFITNARTINAPATTQTFNGSVDMPFLTTNATGTFNTDLDIESISLSLNNNLDPQNVIGRVAAKDMTPGTASIEISLETFLSDSAWGMLAKKLTQDPFSVGFALKNSGGYYGFYIPQVQVSFEDPSSGGQNQDVMMSMSGTAKVGASGESALVIYRG